MLYGLNTKPDGTGQWATLENVFPTQRIKLYDTPERTKLWRRPQDAEAKATRWKRYVSVPGGSGEKEEVRELYVIPLKLTVEVPRDATQS